MLLCYEYLQSIGKEHILVKILTNTIETALDYDNIVKKRDLLWFKTNILKSNIWLEKYNNQLLYNLSEIAANKTLTKQRTFIRDSILKQFKNEQTKQYWLEMVNYNTLTDNNNNNNNDSNEEKKDEKKDEITSDSLRQDLIQYGVTPQFNKSDLFVSQETGMFDN